MLSVTAFIVGLTIVGLLMPPAHGINSIIQSTQPIASFTGANLPPGADQNFTISLTQNYTALLFYAKELGPDDNNPNDTFDVSLTGRNFTWTPPCASCLQGELWTKVQGPIPLGSYNVTVTANPGASGLVSFKIAFYDAPPIPVTFSGKMWSTSLFTSPNLVMFNVPSNGNYTLKMNATAGNFGITLNGRYLGAIFGTNSTTVQLTPGLNEIDISNDPLSHGPEQTQWNLEVLASATSVPVPEFDWTIILLPGMLLIASLMVLRKQK